MVPGKVCGQALLVVIADGTAMQELANGCWTHFLGGLARKE